MKKTNFYHPKFLPTWVLILLMRLGAKLPFRAQIILGKGLGKLFYIVLVRFRKIAFINISMCFPNKNLKQIRVLLKKHFGALGIGFFEIANCFYLPDSCLKKRYQIKGEQYLQNALNDKQNVILLVGHFTTMMIAGRILAQNFKFADIYRPQNNQLFDHIMQRTFTQHGSKMIAAKDSKNIIKTLKSGLPIWYAPDQDLGRKNSIFAPFFNIQTATTTATARLAKITNSVVIPYVFVRTNQGYKINFEPPIDNYPSPDNHKNASKINAILEAQIRKSPEQYLWIHRKFKTRPQGEASFYQKTKK